MSVKVLEFNFFDENAIKKALDELEYMENWDTNIKITDYEAGIDRILIIQPYNDIVSQRLNEFRCFFINGKFVNFFAHGARREEGRMKLYPNICYNDKDYEHCFLRKYAYNIYNNYIKPINKNPSIIRIDISYAIEDIYLDKYSIEVNGQKRRYYVNEIEIQPTFYFNIPLLCNNIEKENLKFHYDVANALVNEILS